MIFMNDFAAEYADLQSEMTSTIQRILKKGWHILGTEVELFEREFARFLGAKYVIGVGNGMEAIQLGLMALGIGPGDEVITTSFSAVATALAISHVGAKPVFADVDAYFHLDPVAVEKKITIKTKAIVPVHLYGQSADLDALKRICAKHKLLLIEDAAQAHGTLYKGKSVGTFGVFGAFSFYPTKNLGAYGDGGAIATNNKALSEKLKKLRNYGQKHRYEHLYKGLNSRLDELQAGILRVKLKHLKKWNARRRAIAARYSKGLQNLPGIVLPAERKHVEHIYHLYVILTEKRQALMSSLEKNKIVSLIHYPTPIHKQPCYPEFHSAHLPETEQAASQVLSLPIHPYLANKDVDCVISAVREFANNEKSK